MKTKMLNFFDVRRVIKTDDNFGSATPDMAQVKANSDKYLMGAKYGEVVYVTQGFLGSNEAGSTTTLGRGGSDYSAALLAEGINADLLEIWTDVAGIATTDPRVCNTARPINEITFQEAAEMATMGAKILHPTTLTPAKRASIPVFVGSSLRAGCPGDLDKGREHRGAPCSRPGHAKGSVPAYLVDPRHASSARISLQNI